MHPDSSEQPKPDQSVNVDKILEKFGEDVPPDFKEQAHAAAGYITKLDLGGGLDDPEISKFVSQLFRMNRIREVQYGHGYDQDAEKALPAWLQIDFLKQQGLERPREEYLNAEERKETQQLYDRWADTRKKTSDSHINGVYDRLRRARADIAEPRQFKLYIEHSDIKKAIESDNLDHLLNGLEAQSLDPNTLKLYDGDNLVFYFDLDIFQASAVEKEIQNLGIKYRGPAQDVYRAWVQENGEVRVSVSESNDRSFFAKYRLKTYSPEAFIADYLDLCFDTGKNPSMPYLTSFIHLSDPNGKNAAWKDETVKKAEELTGYSMVYKVVEPRSFVRPLFHTSR